ncbi:MAG: SMC-Scp complex subunit ScpB [Sedimentisphaerales bacterium]|nr:SMC-Scp complex subunit ScpB [Sedimentisphaerales bacterium]
MDEKKHKHEVEFAEDEQPWRPGAEDQDLAEGELAGRFREAETDLTPDENADEHLEATVGEPQPGEEDAPLPDDRTDEHIEAAIGEAEPEAEESVEDEPAEPEPEITTAAVLEAVLFAADEPFTPGKLAEIIGVGSVKDVRTQIKLLNQKYRQMACSFRIEAIAGGYQMLTLPAFNPWLQKLMRARSETKLSPAALETLAIIAYKQPILRVDIEAIRGVACGEMVRQLADKGLVKIVGRAEVLGRPLLYGTTKRFLEIFGLNSLKDLPSVEDLKKPV